MVQRFAMTSAPFGDYVTFHEYASLQAELDTSRANYTNLMRILTPAIEHMEKHREDIPVGDRLTPHIVAEYLRKADWKDPAEMKLALQTEENEVTRLREVNAKLNEACATWEERYNAKVKRIEHLEDGLKLTSGASELQSKQRDAAYAALDAVMELATSWGNIGPMMFTYAGERLKEVLNSHGVTERSNSDEAIKAEWGACFGNGERPQNCRCFVRPVEPFADAARDAFEIAATQTYSWEFKEVQSLRNGAFYNDTTGEHAPFLSGLYQGWQMYEREQQRDAEHIIGSGPHVADIAKHIHYHECWDKAAYPTLAHAVHECIMSQAFDCCACNEKQIDEAYTAYLATGIEPMSRTEWERIARLILSRVTPK
jgi:hypothetical protein